ncbi:MULTISPECIES: hypothetical protein [Hyphomicrobiales]|jgi:hypothetical protein|uniref:hypothetical protein n=1 Tax=Hyphomicrobiales TaxID=356 RepID=UPI000513278E|nr:hypothetical protein [Agrobacterium pusense]ANV25385.1 hypothetical protein BA939_15055 [Rhizobium sp. S41]KGE79691.1 hypothetical protein LW14_27730 [Rhizobium sp. H41]OJH52342.1 hypothetical protein ATN81_24525 [Agrobacterium pusense]OJH56934.1 hypothetical protein BA725_24880 [Agrobacterium pusense]QWW77525.1 hypothetical protein KP800_25840 [Agrobacterium pusense]
MTTDQNLMLYTKLAGFRLVVLANRFGCDSEFSRDLHDRLVEGLEAAIGRVRVIMALERNVLAGDDEFAAYQLEGETEIFGRFTISLLDDLEIDFDTHEYRINGGDWAIALTADYTGVDIDYPEFVPLTDDELGSLAPIIKDLTSETGIAVNAPRIIFTRCGGS